MDVTKPYEFIGFGAMDGTKLRVSGRLNCLVSAQRDVSVALDIRRPLEIVHAWCLAEASLPKSHTVRALIQKPLRPGQGP